MQAALQPIRDAEEQLVRELKAVERDLHASPGSSQAQALQQKARGLQEAINAHVEHVSAACLHRPAPARCQAVRVKISARASRQVVVLPSGMHMFNGHSCCRPAVTAMFDTPHHV